MNCSRPLPAHAPAHYALGHHLSLSGNEDEAKLVFGEMLKAAPNPEAAFAELHEQDECDEEQYPQLETLLLAFPKELSTSKSGLLLLAEAQEGQEKISAAIKTLQRVITLKAEADDYSYLAQLLRKARRFAETVTAATQAIKLSENEGSTAMAYFERACARSQLGLKKAALADLEQVLKTDAIYVFEGEDADLKPLAALPEFKALVEKAEKLYEEKFGGRVKSIPVK